MAWVIIDRTTPGNGGSTLHAEIGCAYPNERASNARGCSFRDTPSATAQCPVVLIPLAASCGWSAPPAPAPGAGMSLCPERMLRPQPPVRSGAPMTLGIPSAGGRENSVLGGRAALNATRLATSCGTRGKSAGWFSSIVSSWKRSWAARFFHTKTSTTSTASETTTAPKTLNSGRSINRPGSAPRSSVTARRAHALTNAAPQGAA